MSGSINNIFALCFCPHQACVRQRGAEGGTPHLWERRRAEGWHTWSDPGRQTQGSPGGRAGDRLRREDIWLVSPQRSVLLSDSVVSPLCLCVFSSWPLTSAMTKPRRVTRLPVCRVWTELRGIHEPWVFITPSPRVRASVFPHITLWIVILRAEKGVSDQKELFYELNIWNGSCCWALSTAKRVYVNHKPIQNYWSETKRTDTGHRVQRT